MLPIATLIDGARCFQSCIPLGMEWPVANYLMYLWALGQKPPPVEDLANEAACFMLCIPTGMQAAITNYVLSLIAQAPPPVSRGLTTEGGDQLVTEGGDRIIA